MSSSDDEVKQPGANNELKFIADKVRSQPEVLSKTQIPSMKKKKNVANEKIIAKYEQLFGKKINAAKFLKKINNMKTHLKKKTDLKNTGNKRIKLLNWEKVMFEAMECDTNPTITKIPGAKRCGLGNKNVDLEKTTTSCEMKSSAPTIVPTLPPPRKKCLLYRKTRN